MGGEGGRVGVALHAADLVRPYSSLIGLSKGADVGVDNQGTCQIEDYQSRQNFREEGQPLPCFHRDLLKGEQLLL